MISTAYVSRCDSAWWSWSPGGSIQYIRDLCAQTSKPYTYVLAQHIAGATHHTVELLYPPSSPMLCLSPVLQARGRLNQYCGVQRWCLLPLTCLHACMYCGMCGSKKCALGNL